MPVMTISPHKAGARLRSLSETPIYVKALIYGDPGVGKTFLACTAKNPFLILSEWAVARPTLERLKKDRGTDPDTWFVNSMDDFLEAYKYVAANVQKYDTIVVDGVTDLNDRAIAEVLKSSIESAANRKTAHDPDQLEIGDWGKVANKTLYAVKLLRDLPCDVVMTALVQDIKSEMCVGPMIAPKSAQKRLPAQFSMMGYLVAEHKPGKPSVRKLHLDSTLAYQAKNPGGALPSTVENPDLSVLFPQIRAFLAYDAPTTAVIEETPKTQVRPLPING